MAGGRHRTRPRGGRRERIVVYGVAVVVGIAALAVWLADGRQECVGGFRLTVAASTEIAPAVRDTARDWAGRAAAPGNRCVTVDVAGAESADVATAIAKEAGATLRGVAPADGSTAVPAVWIPDSSTWLHRMRAVRPDMVPEKATSIARSPVVVAMPEPVAATFGWPTTKLTWANLLEKVTQDRNVKVGIVEPTRDAAGLSGLLALGGAAAAAGAGSEQATIAIMRALVLGRTTITADLLSRFPQALEPDAIAAGLTAAPLSEQAVIAYNAGRPQVRLAGLYLEPAPPDLDYPYVVMPGADPDTVALAADLRRALTGDEFADRLAAAGLRGADGSGSRAGFPNVPGAPGKAEAAVAELAAVGRAVATWIVVTMPSRMLAVLDISGSMLTKVATAGGATRGQVATEAARRGLGLFDDSWSVGFWVFSRKIDGDRDYRQVLPIAPMRVNRERLNAVIGTIPPIRGGETGLYDTILAAYLTVQEGWDPNAVNSVVLLTDGINRDNGLTLDQLLVELGKARDPQRPIQVIAIGIGDEVSEDELRQVTATAGGGTFIARDPSAIGEIFLRAIALRPGTPP